MRSEWETVKLGDIVNFNTGKLDSNQANCNGVYPFFTCSPITLSINKAAFDTEAVLLAGNNANGVFSVKYYNGEFNAYQRTYVITPKDRNQVSTKWLYFRIYHVTKELQQLSVGSATKFLTKTILDNFEVKLPNIKIQDKIENFLWSLENKIELNRKINQTLEAMAQALFKSWFVDFDPVHVKVNAVGREDALGYKARCNSDEELELAAKELGISKQILDLFPNEFEESELGMIPKGWNITSLATICKVQSGYAFKSAWWQGTGVKVIKIKNIDGSVVNTSDCQCVSQEIADKNSNFKLNSGDCLIAMTGATVGKVGTIHVSDEEYLLNQRVGRFQPFTNYDEYVKILVKANKFFDYIQGQAQGSAQPNISAKDIEAVEIIKPDDKVIVTFSKLMNPIFNKILSHQNEINTLQKTRDTLLPKLLSGELDVSELEIL